MTLSCYALPVKKRWARAYGVNLELHRSWFSS